MVPALDFTVMRRPSVTTGTSYTITLYAYFTDPANGALYGGSATATMTAPTTVMPLITLTPRR